MKLKKFLKDSKWQRQFIVIEKKALDNQRRIQDPEKHLRWSLF